MAVRLRTDDEIEKMRVAGRLAASVLEMIGEYVVPGATTEDIDRRCHEFIVGDLACVPAPLNYTNGPGQPPFPKSICTSVNHVVCHGIPSQKKTLKIGDVVNIDVTVIKDGFHGDTSKMFFVGEPSVLAKRLVRSPRSACTRASSRSAPARTSATSARHSATRRSNRFSVVREFCGHGIGDRFHDEPQILHYGKPGADRNR